MFKKLKTSILLSILFTISLFILLFLSAVVFRQYQSLSESSKWVLHSQQVDLELERLVSHLKDAETGQNGYLLTKDTTFLLPFTTSRLKVNHSLANLKYLTEGNPEQEELIDTLYEQINYRFEMLNGALKLSLDQYKIPDTLKKHLLAGKKVKEAMIETIRKMEQSELKLLGSREQQLRKDFTITPFKSLLLVLFSLLVFSFSFYKINHDLRLMKSTNEQLQITNQAFDHAEGIAGISNWHLDFNTEEVVYSNNLYRMLGCENHCFKSTFENFLEFVHPDDRVYLRSEWEKTLTEQQSHLALFRVIRQDGEIRFIKSIGKLIQSEDQKLMTGINWDITELHLNNLRLEEKNRALENSNAELASFNHIASHDLQEPLRKIQMFVSRILERDMPYVSEASKEAFEKIQISAKHMQNLIDDLLMFSRASRSNHLFERSDLNFILENSLQELSSEIDEKNAEIMKENLPNLNVIPFQIQQLFTNILGNSLKFTKQGISPQITITAEMVRGRDIPSPNTLPRRRYWKISFSDNGIGFNIQYADKIFVLFHRLHDKTEFSGTGIGLAICKKIVDNHEGIIMAESVPGEGATFMIYLPVS